MNSGELFGFKFNWLEPEISTSYPYNESHPLFAAAQQVARLSIKHLPKGFTYKDVLRTNEATANIVNGLTSNKDNEYWKSKSKELPFDIALVCEAIKRIEKSILLFDQRSISFAWQEMSQANLIIGKVIGFHDKELPDKFSLEFYQENGSIGGKISKGNRSPFRDKACKEIQAIIEKRHLWNDGHSASSLTRLFWPELREVKKQQSGSWFGISYADIVYAQIGQRTIYDCISETNPN